MIGPDKFPISNKLVCPYCHVFLQVEGEKFICSVCSRHYPIVNSIPNFCEQEEYWCNVSKEKMQRLNTKAYESGDWLESAKEIIPEYLPHIEPFSRADVQFMWPITKESRILDAGSMWGGMAIPVAQYCKEVFAVDKTIETLSFLKIRAEQTGFKNIFSVGAPLDRVPFKDNYFDLVILNGVLEWVGFKQDLVLERHWNGKRNDKSFYLKNPRTMQIEVLKELRRVLKPSGCLYLAIENRIGYQYLTGYPDDHVNIRFITFLPRLLANLVTKWKRGCEYRTYIYTKFGYKNLLKKAGFKDIEFFGAFPHYINPTKVIPFEIMKYFKNVLIHESGKRAKFFFRLFPASIIKYFSPSILAIARENSGRQRRNSRIIDLLIKSGLLKSSESDRFKVIITGSRPGNYLNANYAIYDKKRGEQIYFCKICRNKDYIDVLKDEAKNLRIINQLLKNSEIEDSIPKLLYYGTIENITILVTNFMEGEKFILSKISERSLRRLDIVIRRGIKLLVKFQKSTEVARVEVSSYFIPIIKEEQAILQSRAKMDEDIKLNIKNLIKEIEKLKGIKVPLCAVHGDYDLCNFIYKKNKMSVVDFEHFQKDGLPFFDIANLIFNPILLMREDSKENLTLSSFITKYHLTRYIDDWLNLYTKQSGLSAQLLRLLGPIAALEQRTKPYPYYRKPSTYPMYLDKNFRDLLCWRGELS